MCLIKSAFAQLQIWAHLRRVCYVYIPIKLQLATSLGKGYGSAMPRDLLESKSRNTLQIRIQHSYGRCNIINAVHISKSHARYLLICAHALYKYKSNSNELCLFRHGRGTSSRYHAEISQLSRISFTITYCYEFSSLWLLRIFINVNLYLSLSKGIPPSWPRSSISSRSCVTAVLWKGSSVNSNLKWTQ